MGLSRHFKKFAEMTAILIEDALDGWMTNESRAGLQQRLRVAAERGAELALEVARLEDEVDRLRFNGPTLWKDEVDLLRDISTTMQKNIREGDFGVVKMLGRNLQIIEHLLDRCDHMPMTTGELEEQVKGILDGTAKTYSWDDLELDDPVKPHEHDNPPPGFAKCTRGWPHTGPCAHPYARDVEDDDDIPF